MFGIGMPEMILILAVALIVIGPKKLPDLAKSLGKAMGEFKKATSDLKESMQIDTELKEVKSAFDDLDKPASANASAGKDTPQPDPEPSDGDSVVDERPADDSPEADASMDQLKAAFHRHNETGSGAEPSGPEGGVQSEVDATPESDRG
jgi:sec-independent protein translocase protein TatB